MRNDTFFLVLFMLKLLGLFIYKSLSQKWHIVIVFSNEHSGPNKSVPQFSIKLKYLQVISSQSETSEPKQVPLYNHFQMRNDTLLLFCYGISGYSKYGCLNFWIIQILSSLLNSLCASSTHWILFVEFIFRIFICVYLHILFSLSFDAFAIWILK